MTSSGTTTLRFEGTGLQFLLKGLWVIATSLLVVTTAWGLVPFYRWFNENIITSDGQRFSLEGRPADVWLLMACFTLTNFTENAVQNRMKDHVDLGLVLLCVILFVATQVLGWAILRWVINHTRIGSTIALRFTGTAMSFVGWVLLYLVSLLTIIGWAWVGAAFIRWLYNNISAPNMRFVFTGSGLEILWRVLLTIIGSILIITIPWLWVWLVRWIMASTHIEQYSE